MGDKISVPVLDILKWMYQSSLPHIHDIKAKYYTSLMANFLSVVFISFCLFSALFCVKYNIPLRGQPKMSMFSHVYKTSRKGAKKVSALYTFKIFNQICLIKIKCSQNFMPNCGVAKMLVFTSVHTWVKNVILGRQVNI